MDITLEFEVWLIEANDQAGSGRLKAPALMYVLVCPKTGDTLISLDPL